MTPFGLVLALIVITLAAARLTRLLVHDLWPPVAWVRSWWFDHTTAKWHLLMDCHYCASPWITAGLWFPSYALLVWPFAWWFALMVWLALAYLAAMVVSNDGS